MKWFLLIRRLFHFPAFFFSCAWYERVCVCPTVSWCHFQITKNNWVDFTCWKNSFAGLLIDFHCIVGFCKHCFFFVLFVSSFHFVNPVEQWSENKMMTESTLIHCSVWCRFNIKMPMKIGGMKRKRKKKTKNRKNNTFSISKQPLCSKLDARLYIFFELLCISCNQTKTKHTIIPRTEH